METEKGFAVITGATSGIGKSFAALLASEGYPLILIGRNETMLFKMMEPLKKASGKRVLCLTGNLTSTAAVKRLGMQLKKYDISLFVNNAGFGTYGPFLAQNMDEVEEMIKVNISSLTRLSHMILTKMKKQGCGRIINISSLASYMPNPNGAPYAATKAYVRSFSEALHQELKGSGITVTTLCPGPTNTGFGERSGMGKSRSFRRLMTADAVAAAGYRGALAGKRVVIVGKLNKIAAMLAYYAPRKLVLATVQWALSDRKF